MDELIIKVLRGAATPSEQERVEAWRAGSAENEADFRATQAVWAATAPDEGPAAPPAPDAAALMAGGSARPLGARRGLPFRPAPWGWALAAGIAALLLARGPWGGEPPGVAFEADAAGPRVVTLQDGSVVKLAPGSRLEETGDADARVVILSGRAFFAVTHDAGRPFVVRAAGAETRVLGTRFEVSDQGGGEVRVVVVEGRVAVSNGDGAVEVDAGSVGRSTGGGPPTVAAAADVFALLDWPDGVLVYQATPLARVADEIARHFQRDVEVRGEELGDLRISAVFEGMGFADVVATLCDVSGAECTLTETGVVIAPQR